jgi:hypothetical protein
MTARWLLAVALALVLGGCTAGVGPAPEGVGNLAGEWRGRWLGPAGHASAALSVEADGAYRMTLFLDGGDRVVSGVLTRLPSGRLRYQGGQGNGEVHVEPAALRLVPDGGGGGGTFRRAP